MSIIRDGEECYTSKEVDKIMFSYIRESAKQMKKEVISSRSINSKEEVYV